MESAKTTEESQASNIPVREVRRVARRASRCHKEFDAAEPQAIREWLWRELMGDFEPETVRAIYPLIISARRMALREEKFAQEHEFTSEEQSRGIIELFGELPPVRPLDAPPKPVDI
jgi:hypothetical protein